MRTYFLAICLALAGCGTTSSTTDAAADAVTGDVVATDAVTRDVVATDTVTGDVVATADLVVIDRPDVTTTDLVVIDRPDVATADAVVIDRPDVTTTDVTDATAVDRPDVAACTGASCHAYWCGCGRCDPATITCTPEARVCPLACAQACPELDTAVCRCEGGACGAPTFPDAGVDAGREGGECASSAECGAGLLCCYPCGIPGCHNRCMAPMDGHCPLIP